MVVFWQWLGVVPGADDELEMQGDVWYRGSLGELRLSIEIRNLIHWDEVVVNERACCITTSTQGEGENFGAGTVHIQRGDEYLYDCLHYR